MPGAVSGNGAEAWRKLAKRWDLVVTGRNRALPKIIMSSDRCKSEELDGMIEKWEASVRKYGGRTGGRGVTLKLSSDLKMTAFECLTPRDMDNHFDDAA